MAESKDLEYIMKIKGIRTLVLRQDLEDKSFYPSQEPGLGISVNELALETYSWER